ncbi:MAG: HAMP domain-containing histidine kinase [Deltaproteobacteria bacterium]|nr:HAMP domain-containing histidine kinase [Deltaproteobacteria bacterium]
MDERLLIEVALHLGGTLDLGSLLRRVVDSAVKLLNAERALLALVDDAGRLEQVVTHNLTWEGPGTPLPISHGLFEEVLRRGAPVFVNNAAVDAQFSRNASVRALGLRMILGMPVVSRGRVVAVLYTDSRIAATTERGLRLETLRALVAMTATAVENARLFEEQEQRAYLLAHMVHDLRTPLSIIRLSAQELLRSPETDRETREEIVQDITDGVRRLELLIDSSMALARMKANLGDAPVDVDLAGLLRDHARRLKPLATARSTRIEVTLQGDLPPLRTYRERLEAVLDNLVFNAIKYATPNTAIRVSAGPLQPGALADSRPSTPGPGLFLQSDTLSPARGTAFLAVTVENACAGLPEELLARLFQPFARGDGNASEHRSNGFGLVIVAECVRSMGGSVWATPAESGGACFTFTLPVESLVVSASLRPLGS